MALSATFQADFTSFTDAVDKADVKLKSFQDDAGKVESALTRMTNSFSGTKVIQEATLMGEAMERLSKDGIGLTESELARMGKTANDAADKLKAMGQDVPPSIQRVIYAAKGAGEQHQTWTDRVKEGAASYIAGMITYDAFVGAGRRVVEFLKDSVAAAAEAEATERRLTVAMENQGSASPALIRQYDELAKSTQQVSTFSDTAVKQLEAMLVQVGNVLPSQMAVAVKATTDLASAMGIDLAQAGQLLAKAAEGNTTALAKMGVTLDETRVKGEGFDYIIGQIEKRFGGQAQAEVATYAGQVKQLGNEWENTKESVGRFVIETGVLQNTMKEAQAQSDLYSAVLTGNWKAIELLTAKAGYAVTGLGIYTQILDQNSEATKENEARVKAAGSQYATAAQHAETLALAHIADQKALDAKAAADAKAAEAAKKHADALAELATFSEDYRVTLATINAGTIEEVTNFLSAGESATVLQEAYRLTAGQIRAITIAREADIAAVKDQEQANEALIHADQQAVAAASKLWGEYHNLVIVGSGTATDKQIADITRWGQEQAAAFEASKNRMQMTASAVADFYNALSADMTTKLARVGVDQAALTDAATNHSKAGLQQIADAAQVTYQEALKHVGVWSDGTIEKFRVTAEAAQKAANDFGVAFSGALDPIPAKVDKVTDSVNRVVAAMATWTVVSGHLSRDHYDSASGDRTTEQIINDIIQNMNSGGIGFSPQLRANGGPVSAGRPYIVGENQPELFVPSVSGTIYPSVGGAGGPVIHLGGVYVTQPLGTPEDIAAAIGDAMDTRLRALGVRFGGGA